MTVDDSDERPLGLRDLAQAESPELVRAALGRFRRRLLARGLIVVLIAAVALFLYPRYTHRIPDISTEIDRGHGVSPFHTIKAGDMEATIERVARISSEGLAFEGDVRRFGIRVLVDRSHAPGVSIISPEQSGQLVSLLQADPDRGVLGYEIRFGDLFEGFEMWIPLVAGTRTIDIPIARLSTTKGSVRLTSPTPTIFHIDMQELSVPDWTWR